MKKKNKRLLVIACILIFLITDGIKSYYTARRYISSNYAAATNIRLNRIYFIGIWIVGFKMDAWHKDAWISVRVAPFIPATLGHTSCK